jgi:hypothetical protein
MITDLIHMDCTQDIHVGMPADHIQPSSRTHALDLPCPATLRRHRSHLPDHRHAQPPLLGLERKVILSEQVRELDKGAFGRHVVARYHADLVEDDAGDVLRAVSARWSQRGRPAHSGRAWWTHRAGGPCPERIETR